LVNALKKLRQAGDKHLFTLREIIDPSSLLVWVEGPQREGSMNKSFVLYICVVVIASLLALWCRQNSLTAFAGQGDVKLKQNSTNTETTELTAFAGQGNVKSEQNSTNSTRTAELTAFAGQGDVKLKQNSTKITRTAELTAFAGQGNVKSKQNSTNSTRTAELSSGTLTTPSYEWVQNCTRRITQKGLIPFNITWESYRLGDCIKLCNACRGPRSDTMAVQYGNLDCKTGNHVAGGNLTLVEEVFQLHKQDPSFTVPAADELVIHLRLGDVVDRSKATVEEMLMDGADPAHAISFLTAIKSIHEYLANIQESGLHKVVIRGGSHTRKHYKKSRTYAGCLKEAIENAGYHVSMEVEGNTPDHDFYYMSHATKVIVSTGGYSRLIGKMVKKGGGIIVGRTF
jgi:hypothetical protein